MQLASKFETRWSTFRSTLHFSTNAEGVFCSSYLAFTRNAPQSAALLFLQFPAKALSRTRLQTQLGTSTLPYHVPIWLKTLAIKESEKERGQQKTLATPGQFFKLIASLNHTLVDRRTCQRPDYHLYQTLLAKAHQPVRSSCWWPRVCNQKHLRRVHFFGRTTMAEGPQKGQRWTLSGSATQSSVELIPTAPRNVKSSHRKNF